MVVVIFAFGSIYIEGYSSTFSIRAILVLSSFLLIACAGQTFVMLIGGIDLSIPFVIGFANVTAAQLTSNGMPFGLAVAVVIGLSIVFGIINGGLSSLLRVHPLIVTLGTGTALLGAVKLWTKGYTAGSAPDYVAKFVSLGQSVGPFPFPWLVLATMGMIVLFVVFENRTVLGHQIYALGSNPTAAPYVLIGPLKIWSFCFALSATLAAITGILLLGFSGSAFADAGRPYLFQTIAAAVIGGTALSGGRGGILGSTAGALALIQLTTVLIGLGLDQSLVQVALGALIVLVVGIYGRQSHLRNEI